MTSYVAPEFVHWLASQYIAGHHLLCFVLCQISPWYHHGSHDTWRYIFTERLVPIASPQYAIIHRRDNNNTRTNLYIFILYIYIYIISIYLYIYIVYISYHMHMKSLCHLYLFFTNPQVILHIHMISIVISDIRLPAIWVWIKHGAPMNEIWWFSCFMFKCMKPSVLGWYKYQTIHHYDDAFSF